MAGLLAVALLSLALAGSASGQQITGEVSGTVHDATGALIVGAKVTVKNTETNEIVRTLETNRSGIYTASLLQVGTYSVKVEAKGFQGVELVGIVVNVNDALSKDVVLSPGESTDDVTVTADSQTPNVENNENSSLINNKEITELALNTRNFEEMALLQPGVSYGGSGEQNTGQVDPTGNRNATGLSINGLQQSQVSFLLDGVDILSHTSSAQVVIFPTIDSIRQIQTIRNNYGAQYGGGGSAEVTTVTRAGGSAFHGDAYYFFRHQDLEATPVFDLLSGLGKPADRYNDFGYTIGGPLFVPHLYPRARSKTFFFFSQEFKRLGQSVEQESANIPVLAETYGYFPMPVCVTYPAATGTGCTRAPEVANSPFPGYNYHICVQTFKPLPPGVVLPPCTSADPQANITGEQYYDDVIRPSILSTTFGSIPSNQNFVTYSQTSTTSESQELGRIDQQFSSRVNGFVRIVDDSITQNIPNAVYGGSSFPGVAKSTVMTYGRDFLAHATWLASPNTVLEFGASYLPYQTSAVPTGSALSVNSPDVQINLPFPNTTGRIPNVNLNGTILGSVGTFVDHSATYQFFENTTQTHGPHSLYFGANMEYLTDNGSPATLNAGQFSVSGAQTVATAAATGCTPVPSGQTPNVTPNSCTVLSYPQSFAYLLLGYANSFTQASVDPASKPRAALYEAYAQDNWRATARLTLNAGLRYSIYKAPWDASANTNGQFPQGKLGAFQPEAYNPTTAPSLTCTSTSCTIPLPNGAYNPLNGISGGGGGTSPYGRSISRTPLLNFAPRVGFALNVYGDGKTSLRGGFGIFYEQQPLSTFQNDIAGNPAYVQNPVYNNPASMATPGAVPPGTKAISNVTGITRDWVQPYVEGWNLGVQQQLPKNTLLEINYVGNNTIHLQGTEDLNQAAPNLYLKTAATGLCGAPTTGSTAVTTSVAYNGQDICYPTSTNDYLIDQIRPYQGYSQIAFVTTRYFADYNGLQVSLAHRQNRSLMFGVNYTWSKGMTNNGGPPPSIIATQLTPQNRYDIHTEWGPTTLDRRHIAVGNFVLMIPQHTSLHGFRGAAVNGWELSGIITFAAGPHETSYFVLYDPAGQGDSGAVSGTSSQQRPDLNADPNIHNGPRTQLNWFKHDFEVSNNGAVPTATWTEQPAGGNIGGSEKVGAILAPGYQTENISLFKNFELPENMRFQFRVEAFNLPNHVSWQTLGLQPSATNFGTVISAYPNRKLQIGAKLIF